MKKMHDMKSALILTALMLTFNETAMAAGLFETIKSEIAGWISALCGIGMMVAGGTWVLGDIFHVSWIEHYAQKNKQGLIKLAIFLGIVSVSLGFIQSAISKMANPFGG